MKCRAHDSSIFIHTHMIKSPEEVDSFQTMLISGLDGKVVFALIDEEGTPLTDEDFSDG